MATLNAPGFQGFNPDVFRTAVKNVMKMGAPDSSNEKATFTWTPQKTYASKDSGGKPWAKDATRTATVTPASVQVDVAVEFVPRSTLSGGTSMGEFDTPRAIITILDDDYALIFADGVRADNVLLGGNKYKIDYAAPPIGLFSVTVYQLHCSARDES